MIMNNLTDYPESQTVPLRFAALERVEESLPQGFGNTFAIIRDGNDRVRMAHRNPNM